MLSKPSCVHRESKQTTENRGGVPSRARPHSNAAGDCDALDGSGSATAPGKSPLATSCSVDSCLGLVLLAKATSSHVSVLSLQKAIAFSISTTVVLEAVVKSVKRVPTPITRSASLAIRLAAALPVTPMPPRLSGWVEGNALLPACDSANGI